MHRVFNQTGTGINWKSLLQGQGPRAGHTQMSNLSEEYNYCYTSMQIGLFINMSDLLAECALKNL